MSAAVQLADLRTHFPSLEWVCFEESLRNHIDGLPASHSNLVITAETLEPAIIVDLVKGGYSFVVQTKEQPSLAWLEGLGKMVEEKNRFFSLRGRPLLQSEVQRTDEWMLQSASEKTSMLEVLEQLIEDKGNQAFRQAVTAIVQEMTMNALLDAPREAERQGAVSGELAQKTSGAPHEPAQKISSASSIRLSLAWTEDEVLLSCSDPFGSLDPGKLFSRMSLVYEQGMGEVMSYAPGTGAGIGCVLIFESCSVFALGVKPGRETLVCAVVPRFLSNRKRAEVRKSLMFFTEG